MNCPADEAAGLPAGDQAVCSFAAPMGRNHCKQLLAAGKPAAYPAGTVHNSSPVLRGPGDVMQGSITTAAK